MPALFRMHEIFYNHPDGWLAAGPAGLDDGDDRGNAGVQRPGDETESDSAVMAAKSNMAPTNGKPPRRHNRSHKATRSKERTQHRSRPSDCEDGESPR